MGPPAVRDGAPGLRGEARDFEMDGGREGSSYYWAVCAAVWGIWELRGILHCHGGQEIRRPKSWWFFTGNESVRVDEIVKGESSEE